MPIATHPTSLRGTSYDYTATALIGELLNPVIQKTLRMKES